MSIPVPRHFALVAALVAGAGLTLAVMALAGGGGSALWVGVAGGAACCCGLVVGSSARVAPAAALAVVAGGALVMAVGEREDAQAVETRAYAAPAPAPAAPRVATVAAVPRAETVAPRVPRSAKPVPPPPLEPAQFVRRFYASLETGRFERAWARLSPAVQATLPTFEAWRTSYATTVSQRVEDVRLEPGGAVRHALVTVDRTPCGTTTERRFEMLWHLDRDGRSFTATRLIGVQLAGVDPSRAC